MEKICLEAAFRIGVRVGEGSGGALLGECEDEYCGGKKVMHDLVVSVAWVTGTKNMCCG